MAVISMKQLLEAGVHFGHQTRRWNPKMAQYIFTERNGIYIIDLQKTVRKIDEAYAFVRDTAMQGKTILFVGTKKQAQESIESEAKRCNMYYVNNRWLGGMLTNFRTIQTRIRRLNDIDKMEQSGQFDLLPKKEVIQLKAEREKLEQNIGGIREMKKLPGALVEVNCETDFVANTDHFKNFANAVAKHVALANPADLDELMKQKFVDDESKTIEDMVSDATVAIGEKITVRRFARYETEGVVSSYIHMGGKVGVMVEVATDETGKNSDLVKEFAHDVCLQIAAAKPEAVRREEVDADKLAKEAEIQRAKAIESGKPEKIVDRIVAGQIEKYYKEVCLLDQQFVKDGDKTITSLMNETAKAAGTTLDIVRYVRFERGEGIEKRKDDLAAEIAAMKKA